MKYLVSGAAVCMAEGVSCCDVLVEHGRVAAISPLLSVVDDIAVIDAKEFHLFPVFVDVHVHLREPGFFYKEDRGIGYHGGGQRRRYHGLYHAGFQSDAG